MNRKIQLSNLVAARRILRVVHENVDPNAFIAGGYAVKQYMNADWTTDIDIYFTSPNFEDFEAKRFNAFSQLNSAFEGRLRFTDPNYGGFSEISSRIATLDNVVDFIQVYNTEGKDIHEYVLSKFDIEMTKIIMTAEPTEGDSDFIIKPSREFLAGLADKKLRYNLHLENTPEKNEMRAMQTRDRLEKYKSRFPEFQLEEIGIGDTE